MLHDEFLDVPNVKTHRTALSQADARKLPTADFSPDGDLGDAQESGDFGKIDQRFEAIFTHPSSPGSRFVSFCPYMLGVGQKRFSGKKCRNGSPLLFF
jgi:hypothetical protein